jgi:CubicO group peptidase (beta-lactamase class C family)
MLKIKYVDGHFLICRCFFLIFAERLKRILMNFKSNRNIKYFILLIFLIFNSFSVSTSSVNYSEENVAFVKNKEKTLTVYPEAITQNISKKLDSVFKRVNKRHDFHGSVLVAKNGKLIFNKEYGYADFKKKSKLDKNSTFQLASVSKQFTAAAILILAERGLIDVNDKLIKYYPDFPYERITIEQLLNHTSGLPKYFWLAEHKWHEDHVPVNSEMIDLLSEENLPLFFRPGRLFDYSNTGYFVLASLVEKVSGLDYGEFLEKNIFDPLDMKHSFVYRFEKDSIHENQLLGYRIYRRRYHVKISGTVNDGIVGDKNVYSTAEDLLKWINGLNSGKIISQKTLEQMYTKSKTSYGRNIPYGYGFRIENNDSDKIIFHNGKWNGFSTSIKQYTNSGIVVILLEHSKYNSMNYLSKTVKTLVEENFEENI